MEAEYRSMSARLPGGNRHAEDVDEEPPPDYSSDEDAALNKIAPPLRMKALNPAMAQSCMSLWRLRLAEHVFMFSRPHMEKLFDSLETSLAKAGVDLAGPMMGGAWVNMVDGR